MIYRCLFLLLICLLPISCGKHPFAQTLYESLPKANAKMPDMSAFQTPDPAVEISVEKGPDFLASHHSYDSLFRRLQRTHEFSGNVLIAEQGKIVHTGSYGYADVRKKIPLSHESVFQLGSVSKIFTAVAIMILYEEGKLDYDDEVRKHIPGFPYKGMTIRHLLTHRSGLSRYMGFSMKYFNTHNFMAYADVLDQIVQYRPALYSKPGEKFRYCNTNYVVLAALVDYLSLMPFEQFLQTRVFDPLGMKDTYLCNHVERLQKPNYTVGYEARKTRGYKIAGGGFLDGVFGDKGVHSTITDLYLFDQALYSEKLLKQSTLAQAYTFGNPDEKVRNYGFGWRMRNRYMGLVYHFGWWRGFRTCFIRDVQAEKTIIILSNRYHPRKALNYWKIYNFSNGWSYLM